MPNLTPSHAEHMAALHSAPLLVLSSHGLPQVKQIPLSIDATGGSSMYAYMDIESYKLYVTFSKFK